MRKREATGRERFDALALNYASKKALAESIAKSTGQSYRTILDKAREGRLSDSDISAMKRRERYHNTEAPRARARAFIEDLQGRTDSLPGGKRSARYTETDEGAKWGRGVITTSDILGINGVDSLFLYDFVQDILNGNLNGFDLDELNGRTLQVITETVNPETMKRDIRHFYIKIDQELPANLFEIFRKSYKDGSGGAVYVR